MKLQQFGHKDCPYERPNQKWVCGWASDGNPCKLGPDGRGHCSAGPQASCQPRREGDQWFCTRQELHGGPCTPGPLPDGSCCHPVPQQMICHPKLSLRARRARLVRASLFYSFVFLLLAICGPWGLSFISPGELSDPHHVIPVASNSRDNCGACHVSDTQGAGLIRPVTDVACVKCHIAAAHQANRSIGGIGPSISLANGIGSINIAKGCFNCHLEHRGRQNKLTDVNDPSCVSCHGNLSKYRRPPTSDKIAAAPHLSAQSKSNIRPVLPADSAEHITSFYDDHPEFAVLRGSHFDATPLRFEHQIHLDPKTEGMQERLSEWIDAQKAKSEDLSEIATKTENRGKLGMTCTMCHVPDPSGRYMAPIRFEEHCATCHSLGTKGDEPVPHGRNIKPFVARVAFRLLSSPPAVPSTPAPKRGPGGPRPAAVAPADPLHFEDQAVFGKFIASKLNDNIVAMNRSLATVCGKCHGAKAEPDEIVAPNIPSRWLSRSEFNHSAHRTTNCVTCHRQALPGSSPASLTDPNDENSEAGKLKWTGRTKEIMLPSIQICRSCHADPSTRDSPAISSSCITCHRYHDPVSPGAKGAMVEK